MSGPGGGGGGEEGKKGVKKATFPTLLTKKVDSQVPML